MAGHFFDSVLSQTTGKPVNGAVVEVFAASALVDNGRVVGDFAPIFSDDGITAVDQGTQPIRTDDLGFYEFWTSEPTVILQISLAGRVVKVITDVEIVGELAAAVAALQGRVGGIETVTETATPYGISLLAADDADAASALLGIGPSFSPVVSVGVDYTLSANELGSYVRLVGEGAGTVTVDFEEVIALPDFAEWHFRNAGTDDITFTPDPGVTISAPAGGSLAFPPGGTVTLKRIEPNVFDLLGVTVPA